MTNDSHTRAYNPVSVIGGVVATSAAAVFLIVFLADLFGLHTNPYLGILFFMILPGLFLIGLILVPLGIWIERRRILAGHAPSRLEWPVLDLNNPQQRHAAAIIALLTAANVVIVSLATYRGVEYMDSVEFCGQVCHTVMQPEFTAYQDSPHSRVACVECHIGSGASWFVRSKLSGTRQVFAVVLNTYPRPLPSPVRNLRPARETCEQCHWPDEFHGDKIVPIREYADDEKNSETVTTLQLHVGGGSERLGIAQGIHWHTNAANVIEYVATDRERQVIPYVKMTDRFGNVREYFAEGVTAPPRGERRRMDCMDCHTRPSHPIAPTAERAVDDVIARGDIPRDLPFVRRETVKALKTSYPTREEGRAGVDRALRSFYQSTYPALYASYEQEIGRAVQAAQALYSRNVFPAMKVTFGTYVYNIGHINSPGCFRCHDDTHKTKDGKSIPNDCEMCHGIS